MRFTQKSKNLQFVHAHALITFFFLFSHLCSVVVLTKDVGENEIDDEKMYDKDDDLQTPATSTYITVNGTTEYGIGEKGDDDESESPEPKLLPFELSDNPDDVQFLLFRDYRNVNASKRLIINDTSSIDRSGLKPKQLTVFIIHGFWSNGTSGMPVILKKAYLEARVPYNIIVVDWGKLSSPDPKEGIYAPLAYPLIVRRNIPIVANRVAEFIQFLIQQRYATLKRIHIVGHSLGAHVSGGAGHVIANDSGNEGQRVARISGLDPAGPLFQGIRLQRRLMKKDAEFVDIYHTSAGTLGNVIRRMGDADFFPNGGHHQPGCVDFTQPIFFEEGAGSCSHSFVTKIYAASIQRNFTACMCDPLYVDYIAGNICPGNCTVSVLAGEPCPQSSRGQFYFETSEDPFKDD